MNAIAAALGAQAANPFFGKYKTYRQTPPFAQVKTEHFLPAFQEAFRQHDAEIARIAGNTAAPTFANTIEALDRSGEMIDRVYAVYGTFTNSEMTDELMAVQKQVTPLVSEHFNNINLNEQLFQRVKAVYDQRNDLGLTPEQMRLTEETYEGFLDSGATLQGADRDTYRQLTSKLSSLTMAFGQNSLKATNAYTKHITDPALVSGIPESQLTAAAERAKAKGLEGWILNLSAPCYGAVLKYADSRELRKEMYHAYMQRAYGGEFDNTQNIKEIMNTRLAIAKLFGYPDFASYQLRRKMAHNNQAVYHLLDQLQEAYLPAAKAEMAAVRGFMRGYERTNVALMPWDMSYYSNKMKTIQYDLDDEMLRPYFELEKVKGGVFGLATRLYGITFKKNTKIQVWDQNVDAYEVFDADGRFLAVLYTDFFPRDTKRAGAWMSDIRSQNKDQRPFVTLTMNFTPPTADKPSLLTFGEVNTFLHEFGHGLHAILSDVTYSSLSCTSVAHDFVELPSQIMENWAAEPEFLNGFAAHYQTGEPIPADLIRKVKEAENFNVAYACCRQLSFGYLDMACHTITKPFDGDIRAFEAEAWKCVDLLPIPESCCMAPTFTHLFSGGYAAGYYGYKWAEVLAADAFDHYTENGLFDTERAASFRENILSKGNTAEAMELYKRFRGQEPTIDALLRHNGIK